MPPFDIAKAMANIEIIKFAIVKQEIETVEATRIRGLKSNVSQHINVHVVQFERSV